MRRRKTATARYTAPIPANPRDRIPRRVPLGRGYIVKVLLVSPAALVELCDDEVELGQVEGLWDDDAMTIYIDKTMSLARQWGAYWHEVGHAVNDCRSWSSVLDGGTV